MKEGKFRSRGNYTTEVRFIRMMRRYDVKGWRRSSELPGRPDFIFPKKRVAVFIDGDFWHGNPKKFRIPKTNCEYWSKKIFRNVQRDREVNKTLRSLGWKVARFWESSLGDEESHHWKVKAADLDPSRRRELLSRCLKTLRQDSVGGSPSGYWKFAQASILGTTQPK
jgi:DNA mismatch endonuclease, patch repair protein